MATPQTLSLVNPLAERIRSGGLGLTLMIRHARTVDIALAAKTCGFDGLFFDLQHGVVPEDAISQMAVAAAIAAFVFSPALCLMPATLEMAHADKDADKGKSDESHGKSDKDHGKDGDKGKEDKGGKGAPSAPELPAVMRPW